MDRRVIRVLALLEKMVSDPSVKVVHKLAVDEAIAVIRDLAGDPELGVETVEYVAEGEGLNINACSWVELAEATGVGKTRCKNIVQYRDKSGIRYMRPADLLVVRGIGPRVAREVAGRVVFGEKQEERDRNG